MTTIVQIRTCGSLQNSEKIVAADLRAGLRKIYPDVKPRNGSKTKTIIVKVSLEMSVDQDYKLQHWTNHQGAKLPPMGAQTQGTGQNVLP